MPTCWRGSCELADVRIVTANDRQVPYLVEKRDEPLVVPLKSRLPSRERAARPSIASSCRMRRCRAERVSSCATSARVFERTITLRRAADERRGRSPEAVASQTWRAADPELPPPAITFDASNTGDGKRRAGSGGREGDNAPLPITRAEILLPSVALRFHHPGTPLFLLYGNDRPTRRATTWRCWLRGCSAQPARELTLAPIAASSGAPQEPGARKFFWIVIGVAAVVLLALLEAAGHEGRQRFGLNRSRSARHHVSAIRRAHHFGSARISHRSATTRTFTHCSRISEAARSRNGIRDSGQ